MNAGGPPGGLCYLERLRGLGVPRNARSAARIHTLSLSRRWPEGVPSTDSGEQCKVPVCRPDLLNTVLEGKGRNVGIMGEIAHCMTFLYHAKQVPSVLRSWTEHHQRRRVEERVQILEGYCQLARWFEDLGMRHHSQEFIDTGPGQGPGFSPLCKAGQKGFGRAVELGFLAMRMDEDVGVQRDHVGGLSMRS